MKKVLGIVLAAVMLLSSVPLAGFSVAIFSFQANAESLPTYAEATSKEVGPSYQTGDHIQFGTYPQSRVTNEATIAKLEKAEKTWKSYGYYSGTGNEADGKMAPGDNMLFADFFYGGAKFRAVHIREFRPDITSGTPSKDHSRQDDQGYTQNGTYYFRYEPLKWRVLDPSAGYVMCENLIDTQAYQNMVFFADKEYWQDDSQQYYANDYAHSSIRDWLNNDFCETAFTEPQKANIKKTELNNDGCNPQYNSTGTNDKVFLLSLSDVTQTAYGFAEDAAFDRNRIAQKTDYAQCQGGDEPLFGKIGGGSWWLLRSPGNDSGSVCNVNYLGRVNSKDRDSILETYPINGILAGVRPACCLVSLKSDTTVSDTLFSETDTDPINATPSDATPTDPTSWQDDETLGLANFTVVNAQTLKPLNGATITVRTADGTKTATTGADGKASLVLPVGKQEVTVSYPGCIARTLKIKIEHKENNIPAIGLSDKPVVDATLTSKEMTYEEITNAGIDVDDPENYNVVKYEATFVFESKEIKTEFIINGNDTYVPNGNGGWTKGGGIYVSETDTVIYPSEKFYLVVSGEVKWLKEMFDVQMYIWNNSQTDTLENLNATLTLPEGLSLAAMEEGEQSATQHIDKIAEGGSAVAQWFVRGDKAGKYSLSATLTGTVMPFEEDFTNTYTSDDTITVYGTGALQFTFKSPETFVCGDKYPITISLTNVSEHTLYNVSHMITGVDAFKVEQFKKGASVPVKVKHPGATYNPYAFDSVMEPGDRLDLTFSVTIDASEFYNRVFQLTDFFFESDALVTAIHENFGYSATHSFGDWKEEPAKYPCLEGKKTRQCKTCGFTEEEVIEAVPHTPGEPEMTVTRPATETEEGEQKATVRCTVCGEIIREWTEKIPAGDGHKWDEGTVSVEPSCQKAGLKIYLCEDCGDIKKVVLPKLDHDLHHVVNPATCTIAGAEYDVCTMCETIFNYAVTPKLPHPWDDGVETVKATCKDEGEKLFTCTVCGEKKTERIPKTEHQPAEPVKENVVEATCAKTGSYDSAIYCKICGALLQRTFKETPRLTTHTQGQPVETIINDATCGKDGKKKITVNCAVCGVTLSEQTETIPATGEHKWDDGKETVAATCVKNGEKRFTCTVCGATRTEAIKATGEHTWDAGKETKAATCIEEGEKTFTCQVCGTEKTEPTPLAAHSYGPWKFLKVPNYHEGGQAQHTCKICGYTEIRDYDPVTPDIIKEDSGTDVAVGYMNETYDSEIELEVTNVFDGASFNFLNKEKTNFQFEIYDISMYIKGEKVQPNGTVLVKLPIPANYSRDKLVIYYVTNTGVVEKMDMWIDGDFACFEAEHFSCYALVDEAKEVITLGDVDGDGNITSADARLALRRSVKLEEYALGSNPYRACDVDRDGNVSSADARSILRVSVKLEDESSWR